jgi:hypothetical protein
MLTHDATARKHAPVNFMERYICHTEDAQNLMINAEELAICRRRGHSDDFFGKGWRKCKWCGMWSRQVTSIEEREYEPPEAEQDLRMRTIRRLDDPDVLK